MLEPELAARTAGAVGFRNVLVHRCAEVDDDLVVANLTRLEDLSSVVRALSQLLDGP